MHHHPSSPTEQHSPSTLRFSAESPTLQVPSSSPKNRKRLSAGPMAPTSLVNSGSKRKGSSDSGSGIEGHDLKEEDKHSGGEEKVAPAKKKGRERSNSNPHVVNMSNSVILPSSKDDSLKRAKKEGLKNHSSSCGDVGATVAAAVKDEGKTRDSRELSPNAFDSGSFRKDSKKESSFDKKEAKRRGSIPYMQNKFDLPREEVDNLIRDFRSVLHKKVIHHGVMYVYPNYICWLSNSRSTKAKIPFSQVTGVKKNSLSVVVETEMNGIPKIYKFSHLYKRTITHKVLTLVWRHSVGDTTIDLEKLRTNETLQDISLDEQAVESDPDDGTGIQGDELSDDDIVLPPLAPPCEKPPTYEKGPILSAVLPLSLPKFWHYFLSDESEHYKEAHIAKGDKDPCLTAWESVDGRFQRTLEVKADVKSKLIKGLCPIRSVQRCNMTENRMLVFDVESKSEGVPYCNDFYTRGYWEVTETPDGKTEIKIWLWVIFVKSILVKAIIEKSSIAGMKDFTVLWLGEAHKKLRRSSSQREDNKEPGEHPAPEDNSLEIKGADSPSASRLGLAQWLPSDWKVTAIAVLSLLVLSMMLFGLFYVSSLRSENARLVTLAGNAATGGEGDATSLDVQNLQRELESLRENVVRLQSQVAQWAANAARPVPGEVPRP